jgi:6-pyruvoyltetrahydropterin/6-carboxytetrahydropterin synthase
MHTITKRFTFDAAHSLPQLPDGHKCKRVHGHTYTVVVTLQSANLNRYGFVEDYGDLDDIKRWIDGTLDHRDLNGTCSSPPGANGTRP